MPQPSDQILRSIQEQVETSSSMVGDVDRQFLIFQLAFNDKAQSLEQVLSLDKNLVTGTKDLLDRLKILDPVDYDDPSKKTYWRNALDAGYQKNVDEFFESYLNLLFDCINEGLISLREFSSGQPFLNVTNAVESIEEYRVDLGEISNQIRFVINEAKLFGRTVKKEVDSEGNSQLKSQLNLSENDILVIKRANGNGNYITEHIGFISNIDQIASYGRVDKFRLSSYGLSKLLYLSEAVEKQSLSTTQFSRLELSDPEKISIYSNQFNGKNTREIFSDILRRVLYLDRIQKTVLGQTSSGEPGADGFGEDPSTILYDFSPNILSGKEVSFRASVFTLLGFYLVKTSIVPAAVPPEPEVGSANPFLSRLFPDGGFILEASIRETRAILEHGEHQTYNKMVATGFNTFFSQLVYPAEILQQIRKHTYYDVFETRNSIIVARPPRYNKIDITDTEYRHKNIENGAVENILRATTLFPELSPAISAYKFSRDADFYIRGEDMASPQFAFSRNDINLETRLDTKFSWAFVGEGLDFPSGHFTDPNLLPKYGLRSHGPVDNPNVVNPSMAKLFSPIALAIGNSETRTIYMVVKDVRPFHVGKLYYIEAINAVGYLATAEITHGYGTLSKQILSFVMVRQVVDVRFSDIFSSDNGILDFALTYLGNAPILKDPKNIKKNLIERAKAVASSQLLDGKDPSQSNVTIPVFRYIPTILDLIFSVEVNPGLIDPEKGKTITPIIQQQIESQGGVLSDGVSCYATWIESGLNGKGYENVIDLVVAKLSSEIEPQDYVFPPAGFLGYDNFIPDTGFRKR